MQDGEKSTELEKSSTSRNTGSRNELLCQEVEMGYRRITSCVGLLRLKSGDQGLGLEKNSSECKGNRIGMRRPHASLFVDFRSFLRQVPHSYSFPTVATASIKRRVITYELLKMLFLPGSGRFCERY